MHHCPGTLIRTIHQCNPLLNNSHQILLGIFLTLKRSASNLINCSENCLNVKHAERIPLCVSRLYVSFNELHYANTNEARQALATTEYAFVSNEVPTRQKDLTQSGTVMEYGWWTWLHEFICCVFNYKMVLISWIITIYYTGIDQSWRYIC